MSGINIRDKLDKKPIPGKVDKFREKLNAEQNAELERIANLPNPSLTRIHAYLQSLGYDGSLNSVSVWFARVRQEGEKAKTINRVLAEYDGLATEKLLYKLVADVLAEVEFVSREVAKHKEDIDPNTYLKVLPLLRKEARSCIETINRISSIREREELEMAGAAGMAEGLKEIFRGTPFYLALEEGIRAIYAKMDRRD